LPNFSTRASNTLFDELASERPDDNCQRQFFDQLIKYRLDESVNGASRHRQLVDVSVVGSSALLIKQQSFLI
jgi:hypothetical protein